MITLIILLSLLVVIFIIILLNVTAINFKLNFDPKNISPIITTDKNLINKRYLDGIEKGLTVVQIALFKMWKDGDILDFDNIVNDIGRQISLLISDADTMKKWLTELMQYNEERHK